MPLTCFGEVRQKRFPMLPARREPDTPASASTVRRWWRSPRLLLCLNALVPFDATPAKGRDSFGKLAHGGLPMVLAQTFRAIIHSRMEAGMDRYRTQYPEADILLFEPDRQDAVVFEAPVISPLLRAVPEMSKITILVSTRSTSILMPGISARLSARRRAFSWSS